MARQGQGVGLRECRGGLVLPDRLEDHSFLELATETPRHHESISTRF